MCYSDQLRIFYCQAFLSLTLPLSLSLICTHTYMHTHWFLLNMTILWTWIKFSHSPRPKWSTEFILTEQLSLSLFCLTRSNWTHAAMPYGLSWIILELDFLIKKPPASWSSCHLWSHECSHHCKSTNHRQTSLVSPTQYLKGELDWL